MNLRNILEVEEQMQQITLEVTLRFSFFSAFANLVISITPHISIFQVFLEGLSCECSGGRPQGDGGVLGAGQERGLRQALAP